MASLLSTYLTAFQPDLLRVFWEHTGRLYDPALVGHDGAYGTNRNLSKPAAFLPEQQRYSGDLWTAAAVLHAYNQTLAKAAVAAGEKMAQFALAFQKDDGSFTGTIDAEHSASLLAEAWSRGLLAMKAEGYANAPGTYKASLTKLAAWLTQPDIRAQGLKRNAPYSHRRVVHAAALLQIGALYAINYVPEAETYLTDFIQRQWTARDHPGEVGAYPEDPQGKAPFTGAYDVSYHFVSCARALQCWLLLPHGELRDELGASLVRGLDWGTKHTVVSGNVRYLDPTGSSRVQSQTDTARDGTVKAVDLRTALLAYGLGAILDRRYTAIGQALARGKGWL